MQRAMGIGSDAGCVTPLPAFPPTAVDFGIGDHELAPIQARSLLPTALRLTSFPTHTPTPSAPAVAPTIALAIPPIRRLA